jgi:hypothetical protein
VSGIDDLIHINGHGLARLVRGHHAAIDASWLSGSIYYTIAGGLFVALAFFAYRGSNYARIALTALGGYNVIAVADPGSFFYYVSLHSKTTTAVYTLLVLGLFWESGVNQWYKARKSA